ncbi:MAG: Polyphenol oxidase [Burkholderia plantarii]|nr:MAG: Polyphenol oxidase [Burkholderia plantarii]
MVTTIAPELSWNDCLRPDWVVAPRVRALVSTRAGGVSRPPFGCWSELHGDAPGGMNLGRHTGDVPADVDANRARLLALTGRPTAAWLDQVHGVEIVRAEAVLAERARDTDTHPEPAPVRADASVSAEPGAVCVVMVADCLPVLFCDAAGRAVGAAPGKFHANLSALARLRLARHGMGRVTGGHDCTVTDRERFYSYRRDKVTGRMAAMIWIEG